MSEQMPNVVHQWRVTGQPDGGFPSYDFTWSSDDRRWPGPAAEVVARGFVARATGSWTGTELLHRTITYSWWERAPEDGPADAGRDGLPSHPSRAGVEQAIDTLRRVAATLRADNSVSAAVDVETRIHLMIARLAELGEPDPPPRPAPTAGAPNREPRT
jgi:hypothetical protein